MPSTKHDAARARALSIELAAARAQILDLQAALRNAQSEYKPGEPVWYWPLERGTPACEAAYWEGYRVDDQAVRGYVLLRTRNGNKRRKPTLIGPRDAVERRRSERAPLRLVVSNPPLDRARVARLCFESLTKCT